MEEEALQIVHLELKYCELCGGLWLRTRGTEDVHCESCRAHLSVFPAPAGKAIRPRLPRMKIGTIEGSQLLVCCKEGNA
jgi:hypothetical protein